MNCSVEGCEKEARHKGLCTTHYKRWWRHGDVHHTEKQRQEGLFCTEENCGLPAKSVGMCSMHYQRYNKHGRTHRINNEIGVGAINSAGYVLLTINGKRVYEHIHLAEKALGRPLPKGAIVHHMNEKPWDNHTPLNLVVCPNQEYHLLLHRRMKELGYNENNSDC